MNKDNDTEYIKTSYWYLDTYSVTPVYRNRAWFDVKLPLIRDFWKEVCFYRNIGCDELLKKQKKGSYDVENVDTFLKDEENKVIEVKKCLYQTDTESVGIPSEFESDMD